jgi:hypothetical protein
MDVVNRDHRNTPALLGPSNGSATVQLTAREKEVLAWAATWSAAFVPSEPTIPNQTC